MKIIIIIMLLISQQIKADSIHVKLGPGQSFSSENCDLMYMQSSDVYFLDAGINDLIYSEFYFACDENPPSPVRFENAESRFYVNGERFKCPLVVSYIESGTGHYKFDCSPQVIFKDSLEYKHQ